MKSKGNKHHFRYDIPLIPVLVVIIFFIGSSSSCNKTKAPETGGRMVIAFQHSVGDEPLETDTMKYVNAAGNPYLVSEIEYFISDVCLHKSNGDSILLTNWEDIHYVDTDIPETWHYNLADSIPEGDYSSISFTFGINEEKNKSLMFVNPPESYMFWPEYLGGGYHYMKLNGKWRDNNGVITPFNFHLGIGQIYDSTGNITGFIQNYFRVVLPESAFSIKNGQTIEVTLNMDVNQWFEDPEIFDFNVWGGDIMQKQEAMHIGCLNGHNVFSVSDMHLLLME